MLVHPLAQLCTIMNLSCSLDQLGKQPTSLTVCLKAQPTVAYTISIFIDSLNKKIGGKWLQDWVSQSAVSLGSSFFHFPVSPPSRLTFHLCACFLWCPDNLHIARQHVCFQRRMKREEEAPAGFFSHKYERFIGKPKYFLQPTWRLTLVLG